MARIDTSGWGEFKVGDLFIKLDLKCRKADFNKAYDCSEIPNEEYNLPLTNAKHLNNGIQFYGRDDDWDSAEMTIDIVSNGAIATGDVYAQPQKTGVLWDSYLIKCIYDIPSALVLQYLACVIEKCVKQFFGWENKCTWDKVKEKSIKLPITSERKPDWNYMECYMKSIMDESAVNLDLLIDTKNEKHNIDISGWKEFKIGDLFDVLKGSRLTKANKKTGNTNFVSTSIFNNGVIDKIGNNEHIHPANTLVVVYDGHATGRTYYQKEPFWASDSVNVLYPKFDLTENIGLYLIPIFETAGREFVYTNKWTQEKMQTTLIKLPVTEEGNPDWNYMDNYMLNMITKAECEINSLKKSINEMI